MDIDKYTNEIRGMKSTQFMSAEDSDGNVHILIQDGKYTNKFNELLGYHRTFPIDPKAPKIPKQNSKTWI